MDKKNILGLSLVVVAVFFVFLGITIVHQLNKPEDVLTNEMDATIMWAENNELTVQDSNHMIYTFLNTGIEADVGSNIHLEYTGVLNRNQPLQDSEIVSYEISPLSYDENDALVQNTTYLHKYLQNKDFTNLSRSFILQ